MAAARNADALIGLNARALAFYRRRGYAIGAPDEPLREGSAIEDFLRPNRVVIGTEDPQALRIMLDIYSPLRNAGVPFVTTDVESAELIKYASNSFLATKISFINEMAELCEALGADVEVVAKGMGLDARIGNQFLHTGPGFGGSCFPKDTRSVARIARSRGGESMAKGMGMRKEKKKPKKEKKK